MELGYKADTPYLSARAFLPGLSPVQVRLTCGSGGTGAQWNHSEQKVNFPHGMLSHPSNTPGKRAELCPSQAKPHFLLSFCFLQGDPGIQGYPGRKVRRKAPVLFKELSALMLFGIMAEKSVDYAGTSCGALLLLDLQQILSCHLCKESLGPELTLQELWNKYLPVCACLSTPTSRLKCISCASRPIWEAGKCCCSLGYRKEPILLWVKRQKLAMPKMPSAAAD